MYQLVIVGASPEGLKTAQWCVDHYPEARIALITQGWEKRRSECLINWQESFQESLGLLAAQGVDAVSGSGNFHSRAGELIYQTENRVLVAANYLLTSLMSNDENDSINKLNFQKNRTTEQDQLILNESQKLGIMGALPKNLILAQTLVRQGHQVDIVSRNNRLLPGEELEIADLLKSYLESLGVIFWFNSGVVTSHYDQTKYRYSLNFSQNNGEDKKNLIVDHFIRSQPPLWPEDLFGNLQGFNNHNNAYLTVNNFLQTVDSQIYGCGNWLRGYSTQVVAQEEAKYVAQRVLSKTSNSINYRAIPFGIDLDPPFYRIGLTKAEADRQGIEINQVIYGFESYGDNSDLRGVCKVITDRQDRILGAHWFGVGAKAGINLFNLAIAKGITFFELQDLPLAEALGIEKWEA